MLPRGKKQNFPMVQQVVKNDTFVNFEKFHLSFVSNCCVILLNREKKMVEVSGEGEVHPLKHLRRAIVRWSKHFKLEHAFLKGMKTSLVL